MVPSTQATQPTSNAASRPIILVKELSTLKGDYQLPYFTLNNMKANQLPCPRKLILSKKHDNKNLIISKNTAPNYLLITKSLATTRLFLSINHTWSNQYSVQPIVTDALQHASYSDAVLSCLFLLLPRDMMRYCKPNNITSLGNVRDNIIIILIVMIWSSSLI